MVDRFEGLTVGDIVVLDERAADLLERFGIDSLCDGGRRLDEACAAAHADRQAVGRSLDALIATPGADARGWTTQQLVAHIVSVHHAYVRAALSSLAGRLAALSAADDRRRLEIRRIASLMDELRGAMLQHLTKEEQVLFPYVLELASGAATGTPSPFGTVANPIAMMEREHVEASHIVRTIRELTNGYDVPPDAGAAYAETMRDLHEFERDLRRHVHLENNVLFPRAKDLERLSWQR